VLLAIFKAKKGIWMKASLLEEHGEAKAGFNRPSHD
jgi:hypothetical protein